MISCIGHFFRGLGDVTCIPLLIFEKVPNPRKRSVLANNQEVFLAGNALLWRSEYDYSAFCVFCTVSLK